MMGQMWEVRACMCVNGTILASEIVSFPLFGVQTHLPK